MPTHTVIQGECLSSIAAAYGLKWRAVWEHGNNSALRQLRKDPNVLYPGDQIYVPDLQTDPATCATEKKHTFVLNVEPITIRLRLLEQDAPIAGTPYSIQVDGQWRSGRTDGDGYLTESIPADSQVTQLRVGTGASQDTFQLQLGSLDPIDTDSGVSGRLQNLGFAGNDLSAAINAFQQKENLPISGTTDSATLARIKEKFGQ